LARYSLARESWLHPDAQTNTPGSRPKKANKAATKPTLARQGAKKAKVAKSKKVVAESRDGSKKAGVIT
jgi:hypothetical protein